LKYAFESPVERALFMMKAGLDGRMTELIDLAKTNLTR
jgi:hypothetical protein